MNILGKLTRMMIPRRHQPQRLLVDRVNVRIPVHVVGSVSLQLDENLESGYRLANISSGGLAVNLTQAPFDLRVGDRISGILRFETKKFPFQAQIRHCSRSFMGVQFIQPDPELVAEFHRYFQAEIEAQLVKRVEPNIKTPAGEEIALFESQSTEVKLTIKSGSVANFQIYLLGHFLDGGRNEKIRYGVLHSDEANKKEKLKQATLTDKLPDEVVSMVCRFIYNIKGFPGQWAEQIDSYLWLKR